MYIYQDILTDLKVGNNYFSVGFKLMKILRQDRLNVLWPLVFDYELKKEEKKQSIKNKNI